MEIGFDENAYRKACQTVFGDGPRDAQTLILAMKLLRAYEAARSSVEDADEELVVKALCGGYMRSAESNWRNKMRDGLRRLGNAGFRVMRIA